MELSTALLIFLLIFVLIFVLRMPIPMGMMTACVFYFLVSGESPKMVAQQTLKTFYTNYTIIAVPLFIFAANVMNSGKVTEKVFGFAMGFVGRFKGGLGHVNVLASLVFSGMTGSAIADASGLGKMEIDAMRQEGYDRRIQLCDHSSVRDDRTDPSRRAFRWLFTLCSPEHR